MAIDARTGRLFVANYGDGLGGSVSMLDTASGNLLRTTPVDLFPIAVAVDARHGHVLVASEAVSVFASKGSLAVLDAASGKLLRRLTLAGTPSGLALDETRNRAFVGLTNGQVVTLDTARMVTVASFKVTRSASGIALDKRIGRIFVLGTGNQWTLNTLDERTGRVLHVARVGPTALSLAVDERAGRVFVGNEGRAVGVCEAYCRVASTVSMLDARTGHLLRTIPVGQAPLNIAVNRRTGRVFVMNAGNNNGDVGTVSLLDAVSGRVVATTTVGYQPGAAAVDEQAGRVYVPNGASDTVSVLDGKSGRLLRTFGAVHGPGNAIVDTATRHVFVASADISNGFSAYTLYKPTLMDRVNTFVPSLVDAVRYVHQGRTGAVSTYNADRRGSRQ